MTHSIVYHEIKLITILFELKTSKSLVKKKYWRIYRYFNFSWSVYVFINLREDFYKDVRLYNSTEDFQLPRNAKSL